MGGGEREWQREGEPPMMTWNEEGAAGDDGRGGGGGGPAVCRANALANCRWDHRCC